MSQDKPETGFRPRSLLIVGVLVILALSGLGIFWVLKIDYVPLRTFESSQLSSLVTQELDKNNIAYQVSSDGLSLLVEKSDLNSANQVLSSLDIQYVDTVGLEIFETSDFGITDFAQKVNYKRALEGELTRTISSLKEVRHARVHLVLAEKNLLISNESRPTASIVVFLEGNRKLSWAQVAGIQDLTSKAVPSLSKDDVIITDQNGVVLSNGVESAMNGAPEGLRSSMESNLENQLYSLISTRYPNTAVSVSVNISVSGDSVKRVSEKPLALENTDGAVLTSREIKETSPDGSESVSKEVNYQYGLIQETYESKPGQINRISAAVYIGKSLGEQKKTELQAFAEAAIGVDPNRGDSLVILAEPVETPQDSIDESAAAAPDTQDENTESITPVSEPRTDRANSKKAEVRLGSFTLEANDAVRYLLIAVPALLLFLMVVFTLYVKERKRDRLQKRDLRKILHLINSSLKEEASGS